MERKDLPKEAQKVLDAIDQYSEDELLGWTVQVLRKEPLKYKKAFAVAYGEPWESVERQLVKAVKAKSIEGVREVKSKYFAFGNVDDPDKLTLLQAMNDLARDLKVEIYIFYKYFGGKRRIKIGLLSKI